MKAALRDDLTLRRIAATLVALAILAERADGRCFPVRWLALSILRSVEPVARAFVVEATQSAWPCFEEPLETGGSPFNAACLASRFRALAAALGALLRWGCRLDCWNIDIDCAPPPLRTTARPVFRDAWRLDACRYVVTRTILWA
jgi:hypothetical protein